MQIHDTSSRAGIRYEPGEQPPLSLCLGLGLKSALLVFPTVVLVPVIIVRAAGVDGSIRNALMLLSTDSGERSAHSQITRVRQPSSLS